MKYIKVNIQELIAALKPSQFRPFKDAILKKEFKNNLNHIFKGKDRIYLPFNKSKEIEVPSKIENYLSSKDLEIVDYKAGLAKNKNGRLSKIGKALSMEEEGKKLLDLFNTSRSGAKKDNLMIVISRHPYDLAGMSTERGWTSCMNLSDGEFKNYIFKDIENGTLIAYVIDSMDKNINKPICRLLIKQYINIDNENDIILYPENKIYGTDINGFRNIVFDWIKTFQVIKGTYKLKEGLYTDSKPIVGKGDKNSKDWRLRQLYYENHPEDLEAKDDKNVNIRETYYKLYPEDLSIKEDESEYLKQEYYNNHPDDVDAKTDEYDDIRNFYYENHPEDVDAKHDSCFDIQLIYYKNHPNDESWKDEKDPLIRSTMEKELKKYKYNTLFRNQS